MIYLVTLYYLKYIKPNLRKLSEREEGNISNIPSRKQFNTPRCCYLPVNSHFSNFSINITYIISHNKPTFTSQSHLGACLFLIKAQVRLWKLDKFHYPKILPITHILKSVSKIELDSSYNRLVTSLCVTVWYRVKQYMTKDRQPLLPDDKWFATLPVLIAFASR